MKIKYKYMSTKKLLELIKELNWRIRHTSYGINDIYLCNLIENIIHKRIL